jgi:hypothetical protein
LAAVTARRSKRASFLISGEHIEATRELTLMQKRAAFIEQIDGLLVPDRALTMKIHHIVGSQAAKYPAPVGLLSQFVT